MSEVLVLYGPKCLQNNKCILEESGSRNAPDMLIQSLELAREAGSVVTNTKPTAKVIGMVGNLKLPDGLSSTQTLLDIIAEYDTALDRADRFLRIIRNYTFLTECNATTNWTVGGDGTNLTQDTGSYQYGTASLNFDLSSPSNFYATIYNSSLTSVDLSSVEATGSFGFWVYLPSSRYVSSIEVSVGSSDANFYSKTGITQNYEGNNLENGWNFIVAEWSDMSETGSPDSSALTYFLLKINFETDQEADTDFRLDGVLWMDEGETRNFKSYRQKINRSDKHFDITNCEIEIDILAYEGVGFATFSEDMFSQGGISGTSDSQIVEFGGSYRPLPVITVTITDATGLGTVRIKNEDNDTYIELTESWSNNDVIVVDLWNKTVTVNGANNDFSGIFPLFELGENNIVLELESTAPTIISQTTGDAYLTGNA